MDIQATNIENIVSFSLKLGLILGVLALLTISFFQMKEAKKMARKLGIVLPGILSYSIKFHLFLLSILFVIILVYFLIV